MQENKSVTALAKDDFFFRQFQLGVLWLIAWGPILMYKPSRNVYFINIKEWLDEDNERVSVRVR